MWQDYLIAIGTAIYLFALFPSIKHSQKPPLITSLLTAIVGYVFAFTYFSLHLWYSMVMQVAIASVWAILAFQKRQQQ